MLDNHSNITTSSKQNSSNPTHEYSIVSGQTGDLKWQIFDSIKKCDITRLEDILFMDDIQPWKLEDEEKMSSKIIFYNV